MKCSVIRICCLLLSLVTTLVPGARVTASRLNLADWYLIDRTGKLLPGGPFRTADQVKEGFAVVSIKGSDQYQYISTKGQFLSALSFVEAQPFSEGMARVRLRSGKYTYLSKDGKLLKREFTEAQWFKNGYAVVVIDGKYQLIDKQDKVVISKFQELGECFSNGLVGVRVGQRWGFANLKSELMIPARYVAVQPFDQNLAAVQTSDLKWEIIDSTGSRLGGVYDEIGATLCAQIPVKISSPDTDSSWGAVNRTGKLVIPAVYDELNSGGGMCSARKNGLWLLLGAHGEKLTTPKFSEPICFIKDAPVAVMKLPTGRSGLIDRLGNIKVPAKFSATLGPFVDGLAAAKSDDEKVGYIDENGKWVIPPRFDFGTPFINGYACVTMAAAPRAILLPKRELHAFDAHP